MQSIDIQTIGIIGLIIILILVALLGYQIIGLREDKIKFSRKILKEFKEDSHLDSKKEKNDNE